MHIKINSNNEGQEIIIPSGFLILNKLHSFGHSDFYQVLIAGLNESPTITISKKEYNRIEKLLALNNKEELKNILKPHEINNVIKELKVNEE